MLLQRYIFWSLARNFLASLAIVTEWTCLITKGTSILRYRDIGVYHDGAFAATAILLPEITAGPIDRVPMRVRRK